MIIYFRVSIAVLSNRYGGTSFLHPVSICDSRKGRKDKEGTDQEQARAHKRYDGLGNTVLARVHLYVNLESGHNHTNPGDGTTESLDVEHHRYHVVVHRRQRIRPPTVIHAAAFRQSRTGDDGTKRT